MKDQITRITEQMDTEARQYEIHRKELELMHGPRALMDHLKYKAEMLRGYSDQLKKILNEASAE